MAWIHEEGPAYKSDGSLVTPRTLAAPKLNRDGIEMAAILVVSLAALASAVILVGGQVYIWANTGKWVGVSLGDAIRVAAQHTAIAQWITQPKSWIGIHDAVTEVPLLACIVLVWGAICRSLA